LTVDAYHLVARLWGVERRGPLSSVETARALVETVCTLAGMEVLGAPFVCYVVAEGKAWGPGVTALVPLVDSHMSLHCLEEQRVAFFDLFSCKPFDWAEVLTFLRLAFGGHGRAHVVDRVEDLTLHDSTW